MFNKVFALAAVLAASLFGFLFGIAVPTRFTIFTDPSVISGRLPLIGLLALVGVAWCGMFAWRETRS